jgi:hypothetical protein
LLGWRGRLLPAGRTALYAGRLAAAEAPRVRVVQGQAKPDEECKEGDEDALHEAAFKV